MVHCFDNLGFVRVEAEFRVFRIAGIAKEFALEGFRGRVIVGKGVPEALERTGANGPSDDEKGLGVIEDISEEGWRGIFVLIGVEENDRRILRGVGSGIELLLVLADDGGKWIMEAEDALGEEGGNILLPVAENFHNFKSVGIQVDPEAFINLEKVIEEFEVEDEEPAAGITKHKYGTTVVECFDSFSTSLIQQ